MANSHAFEIFTRIFSSPIRQFNPLWFGEILAWATCFYYLLSGRVKSFGAFQGCGYQSLMRGQVQGLFTFYVQFSVTLLSSICSHSSRNPFPFAVFSASCIKSKIRAWIHLSCSRGRTSEGNRTTKVGWNSRTWAWFYKILGQGMFLWFCEAVKPSGYSVQDSLPWLLERFAFGVHHEKAFLRSDFFFSSSLKLDEDQTFFHVKVSTTLEAFRDPKSGLWRKVFHVKHLTERTQL